MMNTLIKPFVSYKSFMDRHARGGLVAVMVLITLAVYFYMVFVSIPAVSLKAGGMKLFDMMPTGYSVEYAKFLLDSLGPEGRSLYLSHQIPIDMVYPFLFAICFSFLLSYQLRRAFKQSSWIQWMSLVPLAAGFFDYLENIGIIVMLKSYPDVSDGWIQMTCAFTVTKSAATMVFWSLSVLALWVDIMKQARKKYAQDAS